MCVKQTDGAGQDGVDDDVGEYGEEDACDDVDDDAIMITVCCG